MPSDPHLRYSEDECHELFATLFPQGWAGADVLEELAPDDWERSPLVAVFHPSPERKYEEAVRMHENMERLFAERRAAQGEAEHEPPQHEPPEPPSLEKIRAEHEPEPIEPEREVRELVGMCLWDIFSDNHEVIGSDGRVADLGSVRASGGFLAEVANRQLGHPPGSADERDRQWFEQMVRTGSLEKLMELAQQPPDPAEAQCYGYMDFYLGTQMVSGRADLGPVYRMIFRRLQRAGCEWRYHFPRLFLVDLRPLGEELKAKEREEEGTPDWADYDPSAEMAKEQEDAQRDEELAKMRAELDAAHRESVEEARAGPPPTTVAAYRDVFGQLPEGWPPEVEE